MFFYKKSIQFHNKTDVFKKIIDDIFTLESILKTKLINNRNIIYNKFHILLNRSMLKVPKSVEDNI